MRLPLRLGPRDAAVAYCLLAFLWHLADAELTRRGSRGRARAAVCVVGVGWSGGWLAYRLWQMPSFRRWRRASGLTETAWSPA